MKHSIRNDIAAVLVVIGIAFAPKAILLAMGCILAAALVQEGRRYEA